uniref:Uncharacterized protein n=1 Tax=Candidatus Kentrum sp. MB TaxID=2138164 RepID=A0A450X4A9_9GAMM|nr:MAG: hypothetical protein BECKMB1821G_GA0114241_100728 [Candidatus Kentron sp. MB]
MKLRILPSFLLFLSAYSPLSIIFLIQNFDFEKRELMHPAIVCLILSVSGLSCIVLWFTMRHLKTSSPPITIKSVDNRLGDLINYSIPYMISFFAMDLGELNFLLSLSVFMFMMYYLSLKTHNIFINPVLAMMGYNLYDVYYERNGHECKDIFLVKGGVPRKGERCRIIEISEQLYVVTERNPEV